MEGGRRGPCLTAANASVCAYPQMRRNRVETYVCDYGKSQQPCFVKGLAMDQQQYIDFVLRTVEERDIRFIRLWFTDRRGARYPLHPPVVHRCARPPQELRHQPGGPRGRV